MSLSVHDEIDWQIWLVTERDARRSALPLSWAVLIYGDLAYPWRLYFWHDWEGEPKPDGWFSSFWHGWEDEPLPDGWFGSPDSRPPPDNWQADYDYDEVEAAERCGRLRLHDKLITGELKATGFKLGAPLDSPPTAIHPARWRPLVPDFEMSSASAPDIEVAGIRVLPRQGPPASTESPAAPDLLEKLGPTFGQESATKSGYLRYAETIAIVREIGDMSREQLWEEVKRKAPPGKRPFQQLVRQARREVYGPRPRGRPPRDRVDP